MALQNLRSNTANKRPTASGMVDGQVAINTNATNPGLFFKDAGDGIRKVGPVFIGSSAPNSSPAAGGSTGHSIGEQWLDTSNSRYVVKTWDGTAWRDDDSNYLQLTGGALSGALTIDNAANVAALDLKFDGDTDTGFYAPAANTLGFVGGGNERVRIDSSGNVGINRTTPSATLDVESASDQTVLRIRNNAGNNTRLLFANAAAGLGEIFYQGDFRFVDDENSDAERLRITSDGDVGINKSDPDAALVVYDTAGSLSSTKELTAEFRRADGTYNPRLQIRHSSEGTDLHHTWSTNAGNFTFSSGGTERLRITSGGSALLTTTGQNTQYSYAMKLGQSAYNPNDATGPHYGLWVRQLGPRYELNYGVYSEVEDDNGFYGGETIDGLTTVRGIGVYGASTSSNQARQKGIGVYGKAFNSNYNYNTVIGVRGRVETGTTTFTTNDVERSFGGHFVATGKSNVVGVYADAYLAASPGANQVAIPLLVSSNGSEKLRVTSDGDVLIADTTNSVYNDTSGGGINLKANGQIVNKKEATSTADPLIWLNDTGQTTNRTIALAQDGSERGYLGLTGTSLSLGVNGGDRLRINSSGTSTFSPTMGVGARNIRIWDYQGSYWRSFIGTNLDWDGSNFYKNSDNGGQNWGNAAGITFDGGNADYQAAIRFLTDLPSGSNNYPNNLGSADSVITSRTAGYFDTGGRLHLDNQPCAMAYNAQGQHMAGGSVAEFNSTRFNIGNMYNSSNGRMTVPVDGRYLVAYSGLHDYVSQNAIGFEIRINGSKFDGGEAYQECTSSSNSQLAKTLILSLSANDYVDIYIRVSGTQVHQRYGSFSVTLIT